MTSTTHISNVRIAREEQGGVALPPTLGAQKLTLIPPIPAKKY